MGWLGEDEIELRERLKNERYNKLLELKEGTKKKLLEYEEHFANKCNSEREEMVKTKKKEIKDIWDEAEQQLKNIEEQVLTENENLLSQQQEFTKQADAVMELASRKLKDSISETIKEWEQQNEEMNEKLKESEADLEKVCQRNQIEQIHGVMETEHFRSKIVEKQSEVEEKQFEEVLKLTTENLETKIRLTREVVEKEKKDAEMSVSHHEKIQKAKIKSMKKLHKIKRAEIKRDDLNALQESIIEMKTMKNDIQDAIDQCALYLEKEFPWAGDDREEAKKWFGVLRARLRQLSGHIITLQQVIADIEDEVERTRRENEIEAINKHVSESGSCIAPFYSQLMNGRTSWNDDCITKFKDLMTKITSGIDSMKLPSTGFIQLKKTLN
ncbi:unnamed protein product [Caenorhabditis brenneri]